MGFENRKNTEKFSTSDKVLLSVALAGAGAAGIPAAVEEYRTMHHEYISEDALDLGEVLNKKFSTKLQIESKNGQYILHIGQIHGVHQMSDEHAEKVVERQKYIEQLVIELKQRYGVGVVFEEGSFLGSSDIETNRETALASTLEVYNNFGKASYFEDVLLPNLDSIQKKVAEFATEDFEAADELGLTTPQSKRRGYIESYYTLENFEALLSYVRANENLSPEEVAQNEEIMDRIENIKQQALATPGFSDLVYTAGGATEKLGRENQVKVLPVETTDSVANPPRSKFQTFGATADFHERREDVSAPIAYEFALNNADAKYVPIVYGMGHDFSNNIRAINEMQSDAKYKIGLIRIDYKN